MLELKNNSPFAAALMPALDQQGSNYAVVVIKGTFDIRSLSRVLVIADEQVPHQKEDVYFGEPGVSSLRYEAENAWVKPGVDVLLNGHAYAPGGRAVRSLEAAVQVGAARHAIKVFGNRVWRKEGLVWRHSQPEPFERIALCYENAYGGIAPTPRGEHPDIWEMNPVGKGYLGAQKQALKEGAPLPNLELTNRPIRDVSDSPPPAGFGSVARHWQPRTSHAGTYDQAWQRERMPLLPLDFDERFLNSAAPPLVFPKGSLEGAVIAADNVSESGRLTFAVPEYRFRVRAMLKNKLGEFAPVLDTILVEPDQMQVLVTWRIAVPCGSQFLHLDRVTVDWRAA